MSTRGFLKPDPPAASHFTPGPIHHVPAGCALFKEGDAGDTLYILTHGRAGISSPARSVEPLGPGDIVDKPGLVAPGPRPATPQG